jgi:hypothetical protein
MKKHTILKIVMSILMKKHKISMIVMSNLLF